MKPHRTTKGLYQALVEYGGDLPTSMGEFDEMFEEIFKPTKGPKRVMCTLCGEWITIPDDCSCGNIHKILRRIGG